MKLFIVFFAGLIVGALSVMLWAITAGNGGDDLDNLD